ncbi:MAG: hypothetical protein ACI87W_002045 [Halieaceae bacterium]|jgi:hypothetical protein
MDGRADAVGSMLGKIYEQPLELIGIEEVTTPAGTFLCDHFRAGEHADIYITGPDAILVRFVWDSDTYKTEFVLKSLERGGY